MNPKPYFGDYSKNWDVTKACVPIMLDAFKKGTHFVIEYNQFLGQGIGLNFEGWCQRDVRVANVKNNAHIIRVSNDERRRLLPLLLNYQNKYF